MVVFRKRLPKLNFEITSISVKNKFEFGRTRKRILKDDTLEIPKCFKMTVPRFSEAIILKFHFVIDK